MHLYVKLLFQIIDSIFIENLFIKSFREASIRLREIWFW